MSRGISGKRAFYTAICDRRPLCHTINRQCNLALKAFFERGRFEAGCDEAGRGCLAGPVFAAAVILPESFHHPLLNDSKQISAANRAVLRDYIEAHAVCWAVAYADVALIDRINILHAAFQAMHRAVSMLNPQPEHLLIDGHLFDPLPGLSHTCIVKGDGKYASIAAASILAKTHRDAHMKALHEAFPAYGWDRNKGYPTRHHRANILKHGITPHHRRSFRLLPGQMRLFTDHDRGQS